MKGLRYSLQEVLTYYTTKTQDVGKIGAKTQKYLNETESFKMINVVRNFNRSTEKLVDVVENKEIGLVADL